ncbi:hypothetical protein PILCRDRAFT_5156 [Piloderma croceum F 1598]|uniref:Uncharacterized protein n=1 Tax=Piloderma croceum (strain F 1598) TaxID=765440 RepID=A0A0C3BIG2_PILCF|nr:hypothetical protein PILCRDRAFT_5156 [Piloderma croceum F 1598]
MSQIYDNGKIMALTDWVEKSEESRTGPRRLLRGDLGRLMCSWGTTSFGVIRLK